MRAHSLVDRVLAHKLVELAALRRLAVLPRGEAKAVLELAPRHKGENIVADRRQDEGIVVEAHHKLVAEARRDLPDADGEEAHHVPIADAKLVWKEPLLGARVDARRQLKVMLRQLHKSRLLAAQRKHARLLLRVHVARVQEDDVIALLRVVILVEQADALSQLLHCALPIAAMLFALRQVDDHARRAGVAARHACAGV